MTDLAERVRQALPGARSPSVRPPGDAGPISPSRPGQPTGRPCAFSRSSGVESQSRSRS